MPKQADHATIEGAEIFRTGEHNGVKYTDKDLDQMVENFEKVGFDVPLKLGHRDQSGERAYGWIRNLRKIGSTLVADFLDVPEKLAELIKANAYRHISAEIFFDVKRDGVTYPRALKAVAVLGTETPGVAGLKPLQDAKIFEDEDARVDTITFEKDIDPMPDKTKTDDKTAEARIATLEASLADAMKAVEALGDKDTRIAALEARLAATETRATDAEIKRLSESVVFPALQSAIRPIVEFAASAAPETVVKYHSIGDDKKPVVVDISPLKAVEQLVERLNALAGSVFTEAATAAGFDRPDDADTPNEDAGMKVADLVDAHLAKNPKTSYSDAMNAVLSDPVNAKLAEEYGKVQRN
jgi:hypothetical protein